MHSLNKVCYAVCIVSIVVGSLLSIMLIWGGLGNFVAWRGLGTVSVFFFASLLTLAVQSIYVSSNRRHPEVFRHPERDEDDATQRITWNPR